MDSVSCASAALFDALCTDLHLEPDPSGSRFDPYPYGIPTDLSADEFVRYGLLLSCFKKTEIESSPLAEKETLEAFHVANRFCGSVELESLKCIDDPAVGYSISTARELLHKWFEQQNLDQPAITMTDIERAAGFGPGRSVGLGGKPSLYYFKVGDSHQTAGSDFIRSWYESSVLAYPLCEAAEMARQARCGRAEVVESGNLTFVPKSYAKRRIVVTEPSLSTFFQKGLGDCMEQVLLRYTGIDLSNQQTKNSVLAKEGSIDGSYATMDLTQCSDYISTTLVGYLFPPSIVRWFNILRTGKVVLPCGTVESLHMVSTMGNGFTFPMQTTLLSALVLGVYDTLGIKTEWGVFGDDIVVSTDAFSLLSKVLKQLGLQVNHSKSYDAGLFRESCGRDYYCGHECRGVYLHKYTTDQDLSSCFNRLAQWSARHGILLDATLSLILSMMTEVLVIPPDEQVIAGIHLPVPFTGTDEGGLWHYTAFDPVPSSLSIEPWHLIELGEIPTRGRARKRFKTWLGDLKRFCDGSINEPAVLKALLLGGLRRGRFTFRETDATKFRRVKRFTPNWGYTPDGSYPSMGSASFTFLNDVVRKALASILV